jgi:hypothetical protein
VASAVSLWFAWSSGFLRRPILFIAWFGFALSLQLVAYRFSPVWAIGLSLQVILAAYLGIRMKLDPM